MAPLCVATLIGMIMTPLCVATLIGINDHDSTSLNHAKGKAREVEFPPIIQFLWVLTNIIINYDTFQGILCGYLLIL